MALEAVLWDGLHERRFGGGFAIVASHASLAKAATSRRTRLPPPFVDMDLCALVHWKPSSCEARRRGAAARPGRRDRRGLPRSAASPTQHSWRSPWPPSRCCSRPVVQRRRHGPRCGRDRYERASWPARRSGVTTMVAHSRRPAAAMCLLPEGLCKALYAGTDRSIFCMVNNALMAGRGVLVASARHHEDGESACRRSPLGVKARLAAAAEPRPAVRRAQSTLLHRFHFAVHQQPMLLVAHRQRLAVDVGDQFELQTAP